MPRQLPARNVKGRFVNKREGLWVPPAEVGSGRAAWKQHDFDARIRAAEVVRAADRANAAADQALAEARAIMRPTRPSEPGEFDYTAPTYSGQSATRALGLLLCLVPAGLIVIVAAAKALRPHGATTPTP